MYGLHIYFVQTNTIPLRQIRYDLIPFSEGVHSLLMIQIYWSNDDENIIIAL